MRIIGKQEPRETGPYLAGCAQCRRKSPLNRDPTSRGLDNHADVGTEEWELRVDRT